MYGFGFGGGFGLFQIMFFLMFALFLVLFISAIVRGIGEERSIDEACGTLIDGANGRGGYDNITAVIM